MTNSNRSKDACINFADFWQDLIQDHNPLTLTLCLNVSSRDTARFFVKHNDTELLDQSLDQGQHQITLELEPQATNCLKFGMLDKNSQDTVVIDGQIVQDKFIELKEFTVNNFDLLRDYDFFYNRLKYFNRDQDQYTQVSSGFWFNSELIMQYESPFIQWYTQNTYKNTQVSPTLTHRVSSADEYASVEAKLFQQLKFLKR